MTRAVLLAAAIAAPTLVGGQDTTRTRPDTARVLETTVVTSARTDRRIDQTPLRVEVIGREEVEEKMLMTPGDISMLLNETGGLRVQSTSPSLGNANVRIQGLRGRYTLMLTDGLPLNGSQAGSLNLLQIPPMDLAQVEVIKGVASALYGSAALGGVINLVSRRPEEEPETELLLNGTTRAGFDAIGWRSAPLDERWGYTLLASGHRQERADVDGDRWTDIPGYERFVARPRLFWNGEGGRSAVLTIGTTLEDRRGGAESSAIANGYSEALRTRRLDGGGTVRLPYSTGVLTLRSSASLQDHRHRFGATLEQDRHATAFIEGAVTTMAGSNLVVAGAALQRDGYTNDDIPVHDFTHWIPALFAQVDRSWTTRFSTTASLRADFHTEYGALVNPRLSALLDIGEGWTARASAGTGAFTPTPFVEETESVGLRYVSPVTGLAVERAINASFDLGGEFGAAEVNGTIFGSRVRDAIAARALPQPGQQPGFPTIELVNASEATTVAGVDLLVRVRRADVTTTASYTGIRAREFDVEQGTRGRSPLVPAHTAGLTSVWEAEDVGRVGIEYYFTGAQPLDDNPYRTNGSAYSVWGAIVERHVGRARVFLNMENLGDVRLSRYHPIVRGERGPGGRWTTDAWTPVEGRVFNGGVRLAF